MVVDGVVLLEHFTEAVICCFHYKMCGADWRFLSQLNHKINEVSRHKLMGMMDTQSHLWFCKDVFKIYFGKGCTYMYRIMFRFIATP